jgi:hypothetical protein
MICTCRLGSRWGRIRGVRLLLHRVAIGYLMELRSPDGSDEFG